MWWSSDQISNTLSLRVATRSSLLPAETSVVFGLRDNVSNFLSISANSQMLIEEYLT